MIEHPLIQPSRVFWLCAALQLAACKGPSPSIPEPAATPAVVAPSASAAAVSAPVEEFKGTVGIVEVKRDSFPTELVDVRTAQHTGYERFVLEFKDRVPGYHLEYIDKPVRDCGEGSEIPLAGESWLEIRTYPANAHTEEGKPTILERKRKLDLDVMLEAKQTCDFEAVVTWVVGLSRPNPYRVQELSDPPRLVVDVKR